MPYNSNSIRYLKVLSNKLLTALNSCRYVHAIPLTDSLQLPTQSEPYISPNLLTFPNQFGIASYEYISTIYAKSDRYFKFEKSYRIFRL